MAYMIPLQQQRNTPGIRNKQLVPSLPFILRDPHLNKSSCTVEVVTFSCILMTLGGTVLIWTAIRPEYGSFVVGVALIAFGACWVGIMCALKRTREEMKESESGSEETSELNNEDPGSMTSALNEVRASYQASLMRPMTPSRNVHSNYRTSYATTSVAQQQQRPQQQQQQQNHVTNDARTSPEGAEDVADLSRFV